MKAKDVILLAMLLGGGYALYRLIAGLKDGLQKATEPAAEAIAALWLKLNPLPPAMELQGSVKFPGNILVPLQQLVNQKAVRHTPDPNFAVYVKYADQLWQLQPRNEFGNWPAVPVK